jgi:hypothetical protein
MPTTLNTSSKMKDTKSKKAPKKDANKKRIRGVTQHIVNFNHLVRLFLNDLSETIPDLESLHELHDMVSTLITETPTTTVIVDIFFGFFNRAQKYAKEGMRDSEMTEIQDQALPQVEWLRENFNPEQFVSIFSTLGVHEFLTCIQYINQLYDELRVISRTHSNITLPSMNSIRSMLTVVALAIKDSDLDTLSKDLCPSLPPLHDVSNFREALKYLDNVDTEALERILESIPFQDSEHVFQDMFVAICRYIGVPEPHDYPSLMATFEESYPRISQIAFNTEEYMDSRPMPWNLKRVDRSNKSAFNDQTHQFIRLGFLRILLRQITPQFTNSLEHWYRTFFTHYNRGDINLGEYMQQLISMTHSTLTMLNIEI